MISGRGEEALGIALFLNHRILIILHDVTIIYDCVCDFTHWTSAVIIVLVLFLHSKTSSLICYK